ncbi:uncharacterized protein TRIADDRAFT_58673 [Trichoplax adhaerens]|uniref:HEAT repeat-containing protein 4 n=1 Tax=Trichoplax adhaerens TaxID=10228 RepID=B3S3C9_TRIAD|nr:hypothetical protein TRIADDRAFT_58673 [Trichoplax adhaerens]EDV22770.1 hypothetical protein TRIADDRAFT_58673 [Trichoplax adhaerens]|eukprot:XP_002114636.1 hypothetical protein TRIADDRAFT_58673 [Trichoplax adhaerens]
MSTTNQQTLNIGFINNNTFPQSKLEIKSVRKDNSIDKVKNSIKENVIKETSRINDNYVEKISSDLSFTADVVKQFSAHALPYKDGRPTDLYTGRGMAKDSLKSSAFYRSSQLKKPINYQPPPFYLKRKKSPPLLDDKGFNELDVIHRLKLKQRQSTLKPIQQRMKVVSINEKQTGWDEQVISKLSWTSAKYIVKKQVPIGSQQKTLIHTLATRDKPKSANSFAVSTPRRVASPRDPGRYRYKLSISDLSDAADGNIEDLTVPQKLAKESNRVRNAKKLTESYAYRDLQVKDQEDFRKHVHDGAKPIYSKLHRIRLNDEEIIRLTNDTKFKLQLLDFYPPLPEKWYSSTNIDNIKSDAANKNIRGQRPWKSLPQKIKDDNTMYSYYGNKSKTYTEPDHKTVIRNKENVYLHQIVREWRKTWHLNSKFLYADVDKLLEDIKHDYEHVRTGALQAITVAIINENIMQNKSIQAKEEALQLKQVDDDEEDEDISQANQKNLSPRALKDRIPKELLGAIMSALTDPSRRVRLEAAVGIMTLGLLNTNAKKVLDEVLSDGTSEEKWIAAKCLAKHGYCNTAIISELIGCLSADSIIKHEKATLYLRELSKQTSIINSMLAEQLNNTSWRSRAAACNLIPKLYGTINKDLTQKLINLMWSDWHQDVREAALLALAKAGQGKIVHSELKKQMKSGTERGRVDALRKFARIGIATSDIIDSFLECFQDEYDRVRIEACIAAEIVASNDLQVIKQLIQSISGDSSYKVKIKAMQALRSINKGTDELCKVLLWAIRYENHPEVRAEACKTIGYFKIDNNEVVSALQDRLTLDASQLVRNEATAALVALGRTPARELEITKTIRDEVQQLTTKNRVVDEITRHEEEGEKVKNYSRLLNITPTKMQLQADSQAIRNYVTHSYGVKLKGVGELDDYDYHDTGFWSGKPIPITRAIPSRSGSRVQFLLADSKHAMDDDYINDKPLSATTRASYSSLTENSYSTDGLLLSGNSDYFRKDMQ